MEARAQAAGHQPQAHARSPPTTCGSVEISSEAASAGFLRPVPLALPLAGMAWAWPGPERLAQRIASILSAWAGCGALLASLVLMVRDPRLAAALGGLDSLYRWHHRSGTVGYCLLLIHPLASLPMASTNRRGWPGRRSPPAQDWPEWLGWLGLCC